MRLLHTSDWHLGRSLHRADLRSAQAAMVDALVETVHNAGVDLVVVAGDIYDRAIPPLAAVELFETALRRLRQAGAVVVISSGNHDSAIRLGANASLIAAGGVHLRTRPQQLADPVIVRDRHGPVGVYAIPYLEPAVATDLPDLPGLPGNRSDGPAGLGGSQAGVLQQAVTAITADARSRGLARTVVMAHAWVAGAQGSDSERDITVGGVGRVPASLFLPFSYAALGHLHGPQVLADHVRYSGSPLPYSFSEAAHRKGWWLVDLDAAGVADVQQVLAPVHRPLSQLTGQLEQLLAGSQFSAAEQHYLAVVLTDTVRPVDAMDRLRVRFPHILTVNWQPAEGATDERSYGARVRHRDDVAIAEEFVCHVRGAGPSETERALLRSAFDAVRSEVARELVR